MALHCKKRIFVLLSSLFLYAGCVNLQGASREQVVNHLPPILEVEERASRSLLQIQQLGVLGQLEKEDAEALKEHYDVYSIHHGAAALYLARGDISNYESHVQSANSEIDAIESKISNLKEKKPEAGRIPGSTQDY